jgi:hypothetical protein
MNRHGATLVIVWSLLLYRDTVALKACEYILTL